MGNRTTSLGVSSYTTNASKELTVTFKFDSFGKQTASSGSLTNPFRYTAREFDAETNLQYSRAWYYDPQVGRFVSEDPMRFGQGANFYSY